mgnify:CR=1 FL=1
MALTDQQFAFFLRSMADQLLMYPAAVTGIPAPLVGTFVEGAAVGSVKAGKAKGRKGKVSAYNKAFAKAFKRRRDSMTKKNGDWKKGCNSAKCMKQSHIDARKLMAGGKR